jgi:hypothetical protein
LLGWGWRAAAKTCPITLHLEESGPLKTCNVSTEHYTLKQSFEVRVPEKILAQGREEKEVHWNKGKISRTKKRWLWCQGPFRIYCNAVL